MGTQQAWATITAGRKWDKGAMVLVQLEGQRGESKANSHHLSSSPAPLFPSWVSRRRSLIPEPQVPSLEDS